MLGSEFAWHVDELWRIQALLRVLSSRRFPIGGNIATVGWDTPAASARRPVLRPAFLDAGGMHVGKRTLVLFALQFFHSFLTLINNVLFISDCVMC